MNPELGAVWASVTPVKTFLACAFDSGTQPGIRIIDIASTQFEDGSAYHQYQPLTKKGNSDIGSGFNDDPLWLIAAVSAYIRETGDTSILEEMVPFNNREETARTSYGTPETFL